jgi:alpha-ketoglutarate-dependent taurine dioxygenase
LVPLHKKFFEISLRNNQGVHQRTIYKTIIMSNSTTHNNSIITVEPLIGSLGALIKGVDLSQPLSNTEIEEIKQVWYQYHVLVFRDQVITPEQQTNFAQYFGELESYSIVEPLDGFPFVTPIIKTPAETLNFGGGWHSDTSYQEQPPMGTMLYCIEAPPVGGDTMFSNQVMAYAHLNTRLKQRVDVLLGVFSASKLHGNKGYYANIKHGMALKSVENKVASSVTHPVARTHPETGKKSLYISSPHMIGFEGMDADSGEKLLQMLSSHSTRAEFITRVRWEKNTLALWDNRCVQHYALNDYPNHRREMHRVTIKGELPV